MAGYLFSSAFKAVRNFARAAGRAIEGVAKAATEAAKNAWKFACEAAKTAVEDFKDIKWKQLSKQVKPYNASHPGLAALQLLSVVIFFAPALVAIPGLAVLGFGTGSGVVAGGAAAAWQSAYGVNIIFSTLQSAASFGYGVPLVCGAVSGAAAAVWVAIEWLMRQSSNGSVP